MASNWECNHCDSINGQRDRNCYGCGTQRRGGSGRHTGGGNRYNWDQARRRPQTSHTRNQEFHDERQWTCCKCAYVNSDSSSRCKMCNKGSRPQSSTVQCPPGPPSMDRRHKDSGSDWRQHRQSSSRTNSRRQTEMEDIVDSNERRLVLLGKTGCGKSATGNTILGSDLFPSMVSGNSITKKCRRGVVRRNGKEIHVLDTPGIFDTTVDDEATTKEIIKCIGLTAPGPHAFLLVVRVGRFTAEEHDAVEHFIENFGKHVVDYMIILFTGMDALYDDHLTLADHLRRIPSSLSNVVKRCGKRCVGFNNKANPREKNRQVDELMQTVEDLFNFNSGRYYTNRMYKEAEYAIRTREAELRSISEDGMRREKLRLEEENERVYGQKLREYENHEHSLQKKLAEAESRRRASHQNRMKETADIDKDISYIRSQIDSGKRNGRNGDRLLENKLAQLEQKRNEILQTESKVSQMQYEIQSLQSQLKGMKQKVAHVKQEQINEKERRLQALEKKFENEQKSSRELVRKEVEKGSSDVSSNLFGTVVGLGKAFIKGLKAIF